MFHFVVSFVVYSKANVRNPFLVFCIQKYLVNC